MAAGISDDVIVDYVRANAPMQQLSAQDLIDLRQANVSEKVLSAMMEATRAPAVAPTQTQEASPTVVYSYSSPWYYPYGYSYYPGPYVYPYYYSYPYYRYPYYHYPYYNRPYYSYPYHYSYPYRYGTPPSVHNYRNQPTPQHREDRRRGPRRRRIRRPMPLPIRTEAIDRSTR